MRTIIYSLELLFQPSISSEFQKSCYSLLKMFENRSRKIDLILCRPPKKCSGVKVGRCVGETDQVGLVTVWLIKALGASGVTWPHRLMEDFTLYGQ